MKTKSTALYAALSFLLTTSVSANDSNDGLEEIVVTAQKREQNSQVVPVSLTVLDNETLREQNITDVFDLQGSTPSLTVGTAQANSVAGFSIRGIGTSSQNYGLESSVGLYVDGVYRPRQSTMINELVDIQSIEVLRGPQGTLFGRNTPAGAVQFHSVAPSHDQTNFISATAGNYGLLSFNGAVGGSLGRDLAFRVTGFNSERDGYVSDLNFGEDVLNDRSRNGGKLQLLYTPSKNFSARLIADVSTIDEICCAPVTVKNNFFNADGQLGSDSLLTALGGNVLTEDRVFDDVSALNKLPVSESDESGVSLEMNWGDVRGFGQVTSITAVRNFEERADLDVDYSDVDLFTRVNRAESDMLTQEFRFARETDSMDFVVGAYYFDQELESEAVYTAGAPFSTYLLADPLINSLASLGLAVGLPVADPAPTGTGSRDFYVQDQKSTAVFGQFDFKLSDAFTLSTGLRYTKEEKDVVGRFTQSNTGPIVDLAGLAAGDPRSLVGLAFPGWAYTLGGPLSLVSTRPDLTDSISDNEVTGAVKLKYSPNSQSMYYMSYSTGYKSGGFNTDRVAPQIGVTVAPEHAKSFEVGLKRDFPIQGLRMNLSAHNTVIEDFQAFAFSGVGFALINAGEIETTGAELELWWYPTDTLSLSAALAYNDAEYSSFPNGPCWIATPFLSGQADPRQTASGGCDLSGQEVAYFPKEAVYLALNKQFNIGGKEAYFHADYSYRSEVFGDTNLDPLKKIDGYGLMNLRTGMYLFDNASEVSLWMRNAFDEDYLGPQLDAPLQTGKVHSYAQEPRTYGISIRHEF